MTLQAPKAVMVPSKGAAAFLKNGRVLIVEKTYDNDSFTALIPGADGEGVSFFGRSLAGTKGEYTPNGYEWNSHKLPDEKPEDWAVMYFVEAFTPPYVFKAGDEGRNTAGWNYHVVRSDSVGNITVAVWEDGKWPTFIGYYTLTGEYKSGADGVNRGALLPPRIK